MQTYWNFVLHQFVLMHQMALVLVRICSCVLYGYRRNVSHVLSTGNVSLALGAEIHTAAFIAVVL